jgi:hypothetical protein
LDTQTQKKKKKKVIDANSQPFLQHKTNQIVMEKKSRKGH